MIWLTPVVEKITRSMTIGPSIDSKGEGPSGSETREAAVVGHRASGQIYFTKSGEMVLLPAPES